MKAAAILSILLAAGAGWSEPAVYQKIVAKVGPEIITSFEVESALQSVEARLGDSERRSEEGRKKLAETRKKILDRMVEEKLVVLAAEKGPEGFKEALERGTASNNPYLPTAQEVEDEVDKTLDEARKRIGSEELFEQELKRERLSVSEFRQRLRERLRSQMTFSRMIKNKEKELQPTLRVSDEEAKAFYDEHKSAFSVGDQVNLRHILYSFEDKAKAEQALGRIKAAAKAKDEFIKVCRRDSKDEATSSQGGRLDWIEKGSLRWKEVETAAFSLAAGQVAGPLRSEEGWHLIFVEEKKPGEQKSFDEVKAQVRNVVYQQKSQARIEQWVEDLKKEFFVERSDG